ncbi:MAG: TldD/PmbA family protein [Candidatus Izemoplasmatales bacterium]|jgi:TldD protein
MAHQFSHYLRTKKPLLRMLVRQLQTLYPYVSVLATDVHGFAITVDRQTTTISPSGISECGFVVRVFDQNRYSEYAFNDITKANIPLIIASIQQLTSSKGTISPVNAPLIQERPLVKRFVRKDLGRDMSKEEIIASFKEDVQRGLEVSEAIVNVRVHVEHTEVSKMFLSQARDLEQYYTWSNPRVFVVSRREESTKYAYDGFGMNNLAEALDELKKRVVTTAKLAVELLDATPPEPGFYDVITDPSITGLIAHEAFGHGVEMDMFVKDRAKAKEYMNKRVASNSVHMRDGAKSAFSVASYFFDDEGILAQNTKIIDKGILKRGIADTISALQLSVEPTGNGRRESYKRKAYTRMTNTFFEPGNDELEQMIQSIAHGYMLFQTNNGMEDPKNWGIQCTAHYGREIVDGAFSGKIVSPCVMSGYVIDLLMSITAVSQNFEIIGSGSCGKGYKEWVRVSDGGACLKAKVKIG